MFSLPSGQFQPNPHDHSPQDFRQLRVREGQGPKPEVGRRVGHRAKAELDRVDGLH